MVSRSLKEVSLFLNSRYSFYCNRLKLRQVFGENCDSVGAVVSTIEDFARFMGVKLVLEVSE